MDELLTLLRKKFSSKEFGIKDIAKNMRYKRAKLYLILDNLIKAKEVARISRGAYKLSKARGISSPAEIVNLSNHLKEKITRRFKFTALSVLLPFAHHTPYSIVYLIYVEKGSADDFKEAILRLKPDFTVLINPKKEDIALLMNEANKNKILVIRENAYFHGKEYGVAYHDTAFVDLYFEVTRKKISFSESELAHIIEEVLEKTKIDYTKLLRAALRRNIESDFLQILNALNIRLPVEKSNEESKKSKVNKIIQYFR